MQITGPDVIKTVTGEDVTLEELGGAMTHATKSGRRHFVAEDEEDCFAQVRHLLSYLPSNNLEEPPYLETGDPRRSHRFRPRRGPPRRRPTSRTTCTTSSRASSTTTRSTSTSRSTRRTSSPASRASADTRSASSRTSRRILAGSLNVQASEKAARFIRTCDAFNVPIVTFMDVPGFQPGTDQEWGGIIRRGAKLLYAFTEATVPRLTVITRKAYGGAYVVMNSKHIRADICFAWPTAEFAVMGADAAVPIIQRREIEAADEPAAKTGRARRGVRGDVPQPVDRRRARLHRRRDRAGADTSDAASGTWRCCAASASHSRNASTATSRSRACRLRRWS